MDCFAQVVLEKQNNQTVASYTYGDDLLSQTISTGTNFYGYDGLGSTKFLTDTQGQITDTYQYDSYGEITSQTGTTDNNYLYTGEQYDRSLNQYYLRARYYNQGVGRFTQMDTWQGKPNRPSSLNKYLYTEANPVMNVDPSGRFLIGLMVRVRNFASVAVRRTAKLAKKRTWVIHRVKLANNNMSRNNLSHEFVWALNRHRRKATGFHVTANLRDAARSRRNNEFVPGMFAIIKQPKANKMLGKTYSLAYKRREAFLTRNAYKIWMFTTVGLMKEGDTCHFDYRIPDSSCITWTEKAIKQAKRFQLLPI